MSEALEAEFDTVAAWTERAIAELGPGYAVPGACRGSGSPAQLAWLADGLDLTGDRRFLDAGSGLGGPAAWLVEHRGDAWSGRPVLAEPMTHAAAAGRRMFGLPSVAAWTESLPVDDAVFDAAWSLGVLCATGDRRAVLTELHRVLRPAGRLALLVLVAATERLPESPEGNEFPTRYSLDAELAVSGFAVDAVVDGSELAEPGADWTRRADRVEQVVTRDHAGERAWREADANQATMGRLMAAGHVRTTLLRCTRT